MHFVYIYVMECNTETQWNIIPSFSVILSKSSFLQYQTKLRFVLRDLLKNWVWNAAFMKQFLYVFLTEFRKTLFVLRFKNAFETQK